MWFAIELQATTPVPEWGGQSARMTQASYIRGGGIRTAAR
jgi:hypothetical protein